MKVIKPSVEIMSEIDGNKILKDIERAGRVCYKSEDKITDESAEKFVRNILKRGHEAVIEFGWVMAKIVCDRGVTHEIVRHRLFSFCQESTRYCNYSNDKFGNELTFIEPCFWGGYKAENLDNKRIWKNQMQLVEYQYMNLIKNGATPQEARSILPNSLKTEIVIGGNLREWRHFFKLRTSNAAHPQMQEVAKMLLVEFQNKIPVIFEEFASEV